MDAQQGPWTWDWAPILCDAHALWMCPDWRCPKTPWAVVWFSPGWHHSLRSAAVMPSAAAPIKYTTTSPIPYNKGHRGTCRHYLGYRCDRPAQCLFPHRHEERAPAPPSQNICRHWWRNTCTYGVGECNFYHPYEKDWETGLPVSAYVSGGQTIYPPSPNFNPWANSSQANSPQTSPQTSSQTNSSQANSSQANSSQANSPQTSSQANSSQTNSSQANSSQTNSSQANSSQATSSQATSPHSVDSKPVPSPERWSQECPLMDRCENRGNGCPHRHVVIAHGTRLPESDESAVGEPDSAL